MKHYFFIIIIIPILNLSNPKRVDTFTAQAQYVNLFSRSFDSCKNMSCDILILVTHAHFMIKAYLLSKINFATSIIGEGELIMYRTL